MIYEDSYFSANSNNFAERGSNERKMISVGVQRGIVLPPDGRWMRAATYSLLQDDDHHCCCSAHSLRD